ncbi:MAG: alpha/beta hydrolase [Chloroflexota bacterium]
MEHQYVKTNGIQLHVVQAGPVDGPLLILLHGFPEFWSGWRRQIPALVAAGYRVWVPDQRGYNLSDKPAGIGSYNLDLLAEDVVGLIEAAGVETAVVIGHDWGANVAWWLAAKQPQRLSKMVVMNVPHWAVMARHLRQSRAQLRKSWYIFFFQLPWLPEALIRRNNWAQAVWALKGSSRPGTFSETDLEQYRRAWSQPGAMTGMINWYRAIMQKRPTSSPNPLIRVPTLLIWGAQDRFLDQEMAQPSVDLCENGRLALIPEATHWVQHEEAEQVNELIITFLNNE